MRGPNEAEPHATSQPRPLLEVRHLHKEFGGLVAVQDLSFDLFAGEILGLIGPNGAGKSTTFDLVSGRQRPGGGTVRVDGAPTTGLAPHRVAARGLARTFQHVQLIDTLTALDNVRLGAGAGAGLLRCCLRLDRREEAALHAQAWHLLQRVGLADQAALPAGNLALGHQRLLEIARALAARPRLLLLDEPAAGLRQQEKLALARLLRALRAEGMALLLVEHDMDFVMGLADRLVVMDFGTLLAQGAPAAVQRDEAVREAYLGGIA